MSTELLIQKTSIPLSCKGDTAGYEKGYVQLTPATVLALQEAAEAFLVQTV